MLEGIKKMEANVWNDELSDKSTEEMWESFKSIIHVNIKTESKHKEKSIQTTVDEQNSIFKSSQE